MSIGDGLNFGGLIAVTFILLISYLVATHLAPEVRSGRIPYWRLPKDEPGRPTSYVISFSATGVAASGTMIYGFLIGYAAGLRAALLILFFVAGALFLVWVLRKISGSWHEVSHHLSWAVVFSSPQANYSWASRLYAGYSAILGAVGIASETWMLLGVLLFLTKSSHFWPVLAYGCAMFGVSAWYIYNAGAAACFRTDKWIVLYGIIPLSIFLGFWLPGLWFVALASREHGMPVGGGAHTEWLSYGAVLSLGVPLLFVPFVRAQDQLLIGNATDTRQAERAAVISAVVGSAVFMLFAWAGRLFRLAGGTGARHTIEMCPLDSQVCAAAANFAAYVESIVGTAVMMVGVSDTEKLGAAVLFGFAIMYLLTGAYITSLDTTWLAIMKHIQIFLGRGTAAAQLAGQGEGGSVGDLDRPDPIAFVLGVLLVVVTTLAAARAGMLSWFQQVGVPMTIFGMMVLRGIFDRRKGYWDHAIYNVWAGTGVASIAVGILWVFADPESARRYAPYSWVAGLTVSGALWAVADVRARGMKNKK